MALLACGFAAILLPYVVEILRPGVLEGVELWTVDQRFRLRAPLRVSDDPSQQVSDVAVIIDYDDEAASRHGLGRWPWDRRVHAQLIDWLRRAGAREIVIDLLFTFPSRDEAEDEALVAATRRAGNVILPLTFTPVAERDRTEEVRQYASRHVLEAEVHGRGEIPGARGAMLPLPSLTEAASALGHILRTPDADGVLRRTPLLIAVKGGFIPSLATAAAFKYLDVDPASLRLERGHGIRFRALRGEEIVAPMDAEGRTWINFAGAWGQRFRHYPYSWLLSQMNQPSPEVLRSFEGKVVFIANLTTGSGDQGATPFERDFPASEVHLHLFNMLMTRQFLRDARGTEAIVASTLAVAALVAAAVVAGPGGTLGAFVVVGLAYGAALKLAFDVGVVLPAVVPALSLSVALVLLLAARYWIVDRERLRFLSALGACLPPQTVREISKTPDRIGELLAARRRELTIVFADVKEFSRFAQKEDPLVVQRVLRDYLMAMTDVLLAHGGTLDKYMGDGILAFFGDADVEGGTEEDEATRVADHAANAVRAGLAMQAAMRSLNERWRDEGYAEHLVRIGINTGPVTVGNLGTPRLWDYTVIGHEVNKAQRLEGASEPGGLLLARRTYLLACRQGVLPRDLAPTVVDLKGVGAETVYFLSAAMVQEIRVPIGSRTSKTSAFGYSPDTSAR